jgi:hypothetical protein
MGMHFFSHFGHGSVFFVLMALCFAMAPRFFHIVSSPDHSAPFNLTHRLPVCRPTPRRAAALTTTSIAKPNSIVTTTNTCH